MNTFTSGREVWIRGLHHSRTVCKPSRIAARVFFNYVILASTLARPYRFFVCVRAVNHARCPQTNLWQNFAPSLNFAFVS